MTYEIGDADVLLVVDVQNDFCPGGTLAVPRGDEVVDLVNRLGERFQHVVLTQDWHPSGHRSFARHWPARLSRVWQIGFRAFARSSLNLMAVHRSS
jgi:nicotinamidase/pyrazinamidase